MSAIPDAIRNEALSLGFDQVRFCNAQTTPGYEQYAQMIQENRHGSMEWMARSAHLRATPELLLPGLTSAVVLKTHYAWPLPVDPGGLTGQVSMYAWGRDYHNLIGKRLRRFVRWMRSSGLNAYAGVDSRPIIERAWAEQSGTGYAGKNCCSIQPAEGSLFFLSVILVDQELPPDPPLNAGLEQYCGSCSRCLTACPTQAFLEPGKMDARRCISYLNIEHRGDIPTAFRAPMGRWVFGCDICQTVCPHNHSPPPSHHPDFQPRPGHAWLDLEWILQASDETIDHHFLGSPIRRAKPVGLKRNACIVLGNLGDAAGRTALFQAQNHPSDIVQSAARWALDQIG